jgi:hypothetical protein
MGNACIAYTNLVDTAALITATSSNLLLPVSNITNPHIARKWRGTTPAQDSIIIDMGAMVNFDTMAAFGLTGNAIRMKASAIDSTGAAGEVFTQPDMIGSVNGIFYDQRYNSSIALLPAPLSARYFRIDKFDDSGGLVEVGRVFIGLRTQFSYNFAKGWSRTYSDLSLRSKTRGGQTQVFPDTVFRTIDVTFDFLTQSDRDGFVEDVDRTNALKTDVLFVTNPDSANLARDSVWGLMTSLTPVVQPSVSTFTKQYTIEERL